MPAAANPPLHHLKFFSDRRDTNAAIRSEHASSGGTSSSISGVRKTMPYRATHATPAVAASVSPAGSIEKYKLRATNRRMGSKAAGQTDERR